MHKTAIIVPSGLRNDLSGFLKALKEQIDRKNPGLNYEVIVVRQGDEGPTNEGWLSNVGYQVSDAAYYVFHPTDHVPVEDADYSPENAFVEMRHIQMMTSEIFEEVNGFSNSYPGTCVHVHDLYNRIHKARILMFRREASFPENSHESEEYFKATKRLNSGYDRSKDGLSNLSYKIVSTKPLDGVNGKEVQVVPTESSVSTTTESPTTTTAPTTTQAPPVAEEPDPADFHTFWRTRGENDVEGQR